MFRRIAARLQGLRAVPYPIPAMHDQEYGPNQDLLREQYQSSRARGVKAHGR